MPFNLFHKKKQPEQQTLAPSNQEQQEQAATPALQASEPQEAPASSEPQTEPETPVSVEAPKQEPEATQTAQEQPQENSQTEPTPEESPVAAPTPEQPQQQEQPQTAPQPAAQEQKPAAPEPASKTYLKAMPLKDLSDVENVKNEVRNGNIIILRITPLAGKSIEDVKTAVNDLFAFAESIQGDIARLGEERVVICPKTIRIWREKTPAPVRDNQPLPTAA